MMNWKRFLLPALLSVITLPSAAYAELRIFACEPEWAALAREVGGDKVNAFSATHVGQDPHYIRARPSLVSQIRRADLLFCSGAGLEAGWLPILMQRGAKSGIQPGKLGHLIAVDHVPVLEIPAVLDRRLGDIHAEGNPHVHLDPRNILILARELTNRLTMLDEENAAHYRKRLKNFETSWSRALEGWEVRAKKLSGMAVIVHHKSWVYLVSWLGLHQMATLEPKPGMPPTPSHLTALLKMSRGQSVKAIMRTPYDPANGSEWLATKTDIPAIVLPYTVARDAGPGALSQMFERTLSLLETARAKR
jgi:zinc/manganese transport system substrate-binding protein